MPNALATALLADRARFNAKFAEARHYKPGLDGAAFADLLRSLVAPIVEAVHQAQPESVGPVTETLYDTALDLLAQDFLGPRSRQPVIASGWTHLLPKLARFLAHDPRTVTGAVTNALYNLALTPGARPGEWMRTMLALAEECDDLDSLLKAGQVCSWRVGMAHYRADALALIPEFPPRLARLALALPPEEARPLDSVVGRLRLSPWHSPLPDSSSGGPSLQIVKRVGAFRGFGGLFIVPPIVEPDGDHFLVTDGEGTWLLTADLFGATFHRTTQSAPSENPETPFKLNRAGEVTAGKLKQAFPELAQAASHAANHHTLAVTVPYSHAVYLVAAVNIERG